MEHLYLQGSLGDHVIYTGIPEAYFKTFGKKLVIHDIEGYNPIWQNNPFIEMDNGGVGQEPNVKVIRLDQTEEDWNSYRPNRVFKELWNIDLKEKIGPNLYYPPNKNPLKPIAICEDAGWPSRKGYRYFNDLALQLKMKYKQIYVFQNFNYRDCMGQSPNYTIDIKNVSGVFNDMDLQFKINMLLKCGVYIGYDSGMSNLAAALQIPYVLFNGPVTAETIKHPSCIYAVEACKNPCHSEVCSNKCLEQLPNINDTIIEKIKRCTF